MRLVKTFGPAVITALTAMALIGASSASAGGPSKWSSLFCNSVPQTSTLLCDVPTTEIHAVASNPLLHSSVVDVKCSSSLIKADALGLGTAPEPQLINLEELTWTGCETHTGSKCTVETVLLGEFTFLKLSLSDGHVTSTGGTVVKIVCGAFIECAYGGTPTVLELGASLSGTPSHAGLLHVNAVVENNVDHTGVFCPNEATWLALYEALKDIYNGS
jgi:hypothetical protein